jgi:enoyl-CoA hydratase/carnithine racemase
MGRPPVTHPVVRLSVAGPLATITLDHPPANTLTNEVLDDLAACFAEVSARDDARAVILTGAGHRTFASGADLREFREMLSSPERVREHTACSRRAFDALAAVPQPTVAALQASAVGGGLELALVCDQIVAAPSVLLGLPEVRLGLMPGAGGTQRLARRVGLAKATRMILLGETMTGYEAATAGVVDEVVAEGQDVLERAEALAHELAARPAAAVRAAKLAITRGFELPLRAALDVEQEQFLRVLGTADAAEGIDAFLERRDARFVHR